MKTFAKVAASLLIFCLVEIGFTPNANAKILQAGQKGEKSAKKGKKIDNKIAASDNTPTTDKGTKNSSSKKSSVVTNK